MIKTILGVILFLFVADFSVIAQPAANIPKFRFYRKNAQAFENKNLNKQQKLFFVFFDSDCDHCQHAIQYLNKNHKKLHNVYLYLITIDSSPKAESFLTKNGNNLISKQNVTLLFDLNDEFINKFKPRKYPSLFLYLPNGVLLLYDDDETKLNKFLDFVK